MFKKAKYHEKRYNLFDKYLKKLYKNIKSNSSISNWSYKFNVIKVFLTIFKAILYPRMKSFLKHLNQNYLRNWGSKEYFRRASIMFQNLFQIRFLLKKFANNLLEIFIKWLHKDFLFAMLTYEETEKEKQILKDSFIEKMESIHELKTASLERRSSTYEKKVRKYFYKRFKKSYMFKNKFITYKRYFKYLLRKLKYKKIKKNIFKNWCRKPHWYIPQYLEVDFNTLRISFVYYPEVHEVFYGFLCSFKKIISFYKQRSL